MSKASVTATSNDFPGRLDVPAQGLRRTFRNGSEVRDFLATETQFWTDLVGRAQGPGFNSNSGNFVRLAGQDAAHAALRATGNGELSGPNAAAALQSMVNAGALFSVGKPGRLLARAAREAPVATPQVAIGLAVALSPSIMQNMPNHHAVTFDVVAAMAGLSALNRPAAAEREAIDSLLAEITSLKADLETAKREFLQWREAEGRLWDNAVADLTQSNKLAIDGATKQIAGFVKRSDHSMAKSIGNATQVVDEFLRDSNEKTETFKKKVRQDVVHEVPTTFWNKKANGHRNVAAGAAVAFLLVAVVGVVILSTQGVPLVAAAFHTIGGGQSESALLALVPLAFITIPALAFAWVLRHISRVLVQNLSLGADARLRGTITSTFRALAADRAMSEAELAIALQALFRPIEAKDHAEISPPNLADLLKLDK